MEKKRNILSHNVFCVFTREDDIIGLYDFAEKVPASNNLASIVQHYNCKSMNVCATWKDAEELARRRNEGYLANGTQKKIS